MAEPEQRQSGGVSEAGRGGMRVREGHGRRRDRRGDWGRGLTLQIGRMRCGLTLGELGGLSGAMGVQAVAKACERMGEKLKTDKRLRRELARV